MTESPAGVPRPLEAKRICVVYDCIFPWTTGGAERWYRALVEGLASAGAEVTYLTRLQWTAEDAPSLEGVEVVPVSRREPLYLNDGTRRMGPPVRFGWGVFKWLIAHRRDFDAVHVANFPYFSVPATRLALAGTRTPVSVDWFEVWPFRFWREYAGTLGGSFGFAIQELCIRLSTHALVFWEHTAARLRDHGHGRRLTVLAGLLPSGERLTVEANLQAPEQPVGLFVGRLIKDKGVRDLPRVLQLARRHLPSLRLVVAGEGPERELLEQMFGELGLSDAVNMPGKVSDDELVRLISSASCVIVASVREGYGMLVVEASACGTPSVVAANPENAATGHIAEDVNGFVVEPTAEGIAAGIVRVVEAGEILRKSSAEWFAARAPHMGADVAVRQVVDIYSALPRRPERRTRGASDSLPDPPGPTVSG
ncbi:MAG: glycosyltransferase [Acidimicrobiaceae bacterium]|nr:glycosyltransferase [Acidimicrobiaceae bacterium]